MQSKSDRCHQVVPLGGRHETQTRCKLSPFVGGHEGHDGQGCVNCSQPNGAVWDQHGAWFGSCRGPHRGWAALGWQISGTFSFLRNDQMVCSMMSAPSAPALNLPSWLSVSLSRHSGHGVRGQNFSDRQLRRLARRNTERAKIQAETSSAMGNKDDHNPRLDLNFLLVPDHGYPLAAMLQIMTGGL